MTFRTPRSPRICLARQAKLNGDRSPSRPEATRTLQNPTSRTIDSVDPNPAVTFQAPGLEEESSPNFRPQSPMCPVHVSSVPNLGPLQHPPTVPDVSLWSLRDENESTARSDWNRCLLHSATPVLRHATPWTLRLPRSRSHRTPRSGGVDTAPRPVRCSWSR